MEGRLVSYPLARFTDHALMPSPPLFPGFRSRNTNPLFPRWLSSGDGHGDMVFWDWKTGRIKSQLKCHSKVVIAYEWLANETSKVVTASWDGSIKLWVRTTFRTHCCTSVCRYDRFGADKVVLQD